MTTGTNALGKSSSTLKIFALTIVFLTLLPVSTVRFCDKRKADLEGAIADYSKALEFKLDDAGIYYGRGIARQANKDLIGALADYSKAIDLDPTLAAAFANRAVIETLQNKKTDADRDFEKAFKLDPALRDTYRDFIEKRRRP